MRNKITTLGVRGIGDLCSDGGNRESVYEKESVCERDNGNRDNENNGNRNNGNNGNRDNGNNGNRDKKPTTVITDELLNDLRIESLQIDSPTEDDMMNLHQLIYRGLITREGFKFLIFTNLNEKYMPGIIGLRDRLRQMKQAGALKGDGKLRGDGKLKGDGKLRDDELEPNQGPVIITDIEPYGIEDYTRIVPSFYKLHA